MSRRIVWALVLASTVAAAPVESPADFAFRAPITIAADAPLQRLPLPAAALVRLQQPDFADLRIFDADGRAMSMALLPPAPRETERRQFPLLPLPILGAPGSLTVTGIGLRVDPGGAARVVRIDGSVAPTTGTAVLGILFDTRAAKGLATELALDVEVPRQQPVTFQVEGSADLRQWETVTDYVAYRSPGEPPREVIPLDDDDGPHRYLRVTWRAATPLLSPVTVSGASLTTTRDAAAPRVAAELTGAVLVDAHDLQFTLPFATPVAAVLITPAADTVVPVRVLGRSDTEQPWSLIGEGTVYRLTRAGAVTTGQPILLDQRAFRQIRVEADKRTAGFTAIPRLDLKFDLREVAVLLTGRAPYDLAAGKLTAPPAFLPTSAVTAGAGDVDVRTLPAASTVPTTASVASVTEPVGGIPRQWILWAALLGGVLVLGVFAWLAARKPPQAG